MLIPELHPEKNKRIPCSVGSHSDVSDWNGTPADGGFGFLSGKRFYSPATELNYKKGEADAVVHPQQMFGMVITGL